MTSPRRALLACTLLMTLVLSGCGSLGGTGDKGYVDAAGVITQVAVADRTKPGNVAGETLDGDQVSLSQYLGKIVVVNVWGSWCPPCRAEIGDLVEASRRLQPDGVVFLGINTKDLSKDIALAFQRKQGVPYASIFDPGGVNLQAFRNTLTPSSIPSTVIIDREGRVAVRILGQVRSATTLVNLVQDVDQ